jgi:hypothetical protein
LHLYGNRLTPSQKTGSAGSEIKAAFGEEFRIEPGPRMRRRKPLLCKRPQRYKRRTADPFMEPAVLSFYPDFLTW